MDLLIGFEVYYVSRQRRLSSFTEKGLHSELGQEHFQKIFWIRL